MKVGKNRSLWLVLGLIPLLGGGCDRSRILPMPPGSEVPRLMRPYQEPPALPPEVENPRNLEEALAVAIRNHPEVQAAYARVESARGRMIQAGLYPNPIAGPSLNEVGTSTGPLGEDGVRLTQTFVTANKLGLARAAGAREVEAADWQAVTRWFDVVTRARLAYFELLTALRERATLTEIVGVSDKILKTAKSLVKSGAGYYPDVLRAEVELENNRLKVQVATQRVEAARQNLITAFGLPFKADRLEENLADLDQVPPDFDWQTMLEIMRNSSDLQEARAFIAQQEKLLEKARADAIPNVTVTWLPFYWVQEDNTVRNEVFLQIPVPLFDRNQGNIYAAQAELTKAKSDERQRELLLTTRLTNAYQRYRSAREQVESYKQTIVRKAAESLKLIQAGYEAKDRKYDYTTVLQAEHVLFQAQLAQILAMGELWRATVDLAGILQLENLHTRLPQPQSLPEEGPRAEIHFGDELPDLNQTGRQR